MPFRNLHRAEDRAKPYRRLRVIDWKSHSNGHFEENTRLALTEVLRRRGYDAIHARELERLGVDHLSQLEFAVHECRCFLICNVGEFVLLHGCFVKQGREHFGIVVSAQKPVGRMLREMLTFLQSHTAIEIRSQVFFL